MDKANLLITNVLASGGNWDLTSFLENSQDMVKTWGGAFLVLIGLIGVIYSVFQIVTGLMSQGKKQVNYGTLAILFVISGALSTTGITLVMNISKGGQKTIESLGKGSTINILKGFDLSTIWLLAKNGLLF